MEFMPVCTGLNYKSNCCSSLPETNFDEPLIQVGEMRIRPDEQIVDFRKLKKKTARCRAEERNSVNSGAQLFTGLSNVQPEGKRYRTGRS